MSLSAHGDTTLVLKPSRLKWVLVSLVGFLFVGAALWLVSLGQGVPAYAGLVFFALVVVVGLVNVFTDLSSLTLRPDGFLTRSLGRSYFTSWQDCSEFRAGRIARRSVVVYDVAHDQAGPADTARAMTGASAALPDTYGHSAEDLASLMNSWRSRALSEPQSVETPPSSNLR